MKKLLLVIITISVCVNILLILYLFNCKDLFIPKSVPKTQSNYPFLSKRIFMEDQNDMLINFIDLRNQINSYMKHVPNRMGVYFEYLPSGVSIGINEKESFVLASLLKVPLAMAVYKQVEEGHSSLQKKLTITKNDINPYFGNLWKQGAGKQITVEEAIRYTLVDSDNTAKSVLFNHVPYGTIEEVFDYLDIPKELSSNGTLPVVTAKNYSSILRSLYLATYLNKTNSNKILDLLTITPFNDKLAAPIPKSVKIAHKIGVHETMAKPDSRIYTDCGIVYVPQRPYIVCLMMQGDEKDAQTYMSEISNKIYTYVIHANGINKE